MIAGFVGTQYAGQGGGGHQPATEKTGPIGRASGGGYRRGGPGGRGSFGPRRNRRPGDVRPHLGPAHPPGTPRKKHDFVVEFVKLIGHLQKSFENL